MIGATDQQTKGHERIEQQLCIEILKSCSKPDFKKRKATMLRTQVFLFLHTFVGTTQYKLATRLKNA